MFRWQDKSVVSHLRVQCVELADQGDYTCHVSGGKPQTTTLRVRGEAACQTTACLRVERPAGRRTPLPDNGASEGGADSRLAGRQSILIGLTFCD